MTAVQTAVGVFDYPTCVLTVGLPGSGKSTWAREFQAEHPRTVLVSKDELRAMMHNSSWSRANERQVERIRDHIVEDSLYHGRHVIVHDTNLHLVHFLNLRFLVEGLITEDGGKASIAVKSFLDVPAETCIARDAERTGKAQVGEGVIRRMVRDQMGPEKLDLLRANIRDFEI